MKARTSGSYLWQVKELLSRWKRFAYRAAISAWTFVLTSLPVFAFALLTVSYQTIKAATADPVKSLKYE